MPHLKEEIEKNDYTQKLISEDNIKNNLSRETIEAAIIYSGLELPVRDSEYKLFDSHDNMLTLTYVLQTDSYYKTVGELV